MTTGRRKIMAMRTFAELEERFPHLADSFVVSGKVGGDAPLHFTCHLWPSYFPVGEDAKREDIERRITEVMDALNVVVGKTLKWTKNDPSEGSYDETYYRMDAALSDVATVAIITERAVVCERVVVLTGTEEVEERDPELVAKALELIPTVTVQKPKEIVEWQCNPVIAAKTNESLVPA